MTTRHIFGHLFEMRRVRAGIQPNAAMETMRTAKYQRYCGPEEAASRLRIRLETIAESAYGVNQFYGLAFVNFPTKEPDKSIQSVFLDIFGWTPDGSEDGVARSDFAFPPHEEFEEAKFRGSKMNFPLAAEDTPLDDLPPKIRNAKRSRAQLGVSCRFPRSRRATSSPSIPGSMTSRRSRSKALLSASSRAERPSAARLTA